MTNEQRSSNLCCRFFASFIKVVVSKCLDAEQRKLMKALEAEARAIEEAAAKEMGPII